jgi:signal recognition particle GTPase
MVVKIVHDELVEMLGSEAQPIDLNAAAARADHDGRPAGLG